MSVKIYSLPDCPACNATKAFLKEKKIDYTDVDVSEDEAAQKEMIEKSGGRSTPVIDIDGKIIVGFDQAKLEEALNL